MKDWLANNKGITIILVIIIVILLVAVVAGPSIWVGFLAAHGL